MREVVSITVIWTTVLSVYILHQVVSWQCPDSVSDVSRVKAYSEVSQAPGSDCGLARTRHMAARDTSRDFMITRLVI